MERTATPSLRRNFTWTFFGNVIYSACQWGILVVLAKLGNPEMVGKYALGLAVTAPVMMFAQLQLRGVQATDAKREYSFGDYLALRLLTTALALAAVIGIAAFARYGRETTLVILVVGGMKALDSMSDIYFGLWQQNERMEGIAKVMAVNGIVSVIALTATMWYTHNVVWAALASAAGSGVALVSALLRNRPMAALARESGRPKWHSLTLWRLARLALPLGIVMMLISLNTNIPRYYIQHYLGERQLGIFAAIAYLMVAGTTVVSALGQSATPRLARLFAEGKISEFRKLIARLELCILGIAFVGYALSAFCGRLILSRLYTPEFASSAPIFVWVTVVTAVAFGGQIFGYGMTSAHSFKLQVPLFIVIVLTAFGGCACLVPPFGLMGAVWALGGSMVIQFVGSGIVLGLALRSGGRLSSANVNRRAGQGAAGTI